MPRFPIITTQAIPAKSGVALLARVVGYNRTPITQATLSAIAYTLSDLTLGTVLQSAIALTVSAVVFDALQQGDAAWTRDGANLPAPPPPTSDGLYGYNFRTIIPAAQIPTHGDSYLAEVRFTPTSGEPFTVQFKWATLAGYL